MTKRSERQGEIEKIRGDQWGEERNFRELRLDEDRGCYDERRVEETQIVRDESLKKNGSSQRKRYMTSSIVSNAAHLVTAMESEVKTSTKDVIMRRWNGENEIFDEVLQQDCSPEIRRRIRCDAIVRRIF